MFRRYSSATESVSGRLAMVGVCFDRFYTSADLLKDLHVRGEMACGTVRSNRKGLPKELFPSNMRLDRHNYRVAQKDELSFGVWMDTKAVMILSNFHNPNETGEVSRRGEDRSRQRIVVPKMLSDYQEHMKGVDKCDQMISYYMFDHRSKKWWRRLFFHLMLVSAYNSYVILHDANHEAAKEKGLNHFKDFIEDLAQDLIGDTRAAKAVPLVPERCRGTTRHNITRMFEKNKTCHECSLSQNPGTRRGVTKYGCEECNVAVHLTCQSQHITRCINED